MRALLIAVAGAVLLAGCASGGGGHAATNPKTSSSPSSSSGSGTARPATEMRTFTPYTAGGQLTVPVAQRLSGRCWETSLAAPAAKNYRCLAGNRILDPCIATPGDAKQGPRTLECFADPWSKAVELRTRHLPKPQSVTERPWAIALANGERCVAATGTANFVAGVGLDYSCGGGDAAALRHLHARQVTALVGHVGGSTLQHIAVRTIWRG